MKLFPKGAWGYALLLVILFSIAAIATKQVIDLTTERFLLPEYERAMQGFSLAIWLLTMGLMFLAGAFGLLAISATAEYESRHRITRIINTMNYLSDGLLALDYRGYVRGANSAVHRLAPVHITVGRKCAINGVFPSLTKEDMRRLLNRNAPCEIETECLHPSGLCMLRFRSQPVEGLILVFISDITEMHAANIRQQQIARLQLLGRIAGGVAHDFSNILSAISGHAVLMQRFSEDKRLLNDSIGVIVNETQRGVRLSRQLLVLSRSSDFDGHSSGNLAENVREAEELLRVALSAAWIVEAEAKGTFPIVPLSPAQIIQIILNLGLLAADALKKPGKLAIHLKQPDKFYQAKGMISQDSRRFAAVITILASAEPAKTGSALSDLSSLRSPERVAPRDGVGPSPTDLSAIALAKVEADSLLRHGATRGQVAKAGSEDAGKMMLPQMQTGATGIIDTTGVIPSVVRTMIEEAGGRLDDLYASSTKSLYRIYLPFASRVDEPGLTPLKSAIRDPFRLPARHSPPEREAPRDAREDDGGKPWPSSLAGTPAQARPGSSARAQAVRQWKILLAYSGDRLKWLDKTLTDMGAVIDKKAAIDKVLGAIDSEHKPDVIIADKRLFGDEANSLLKAVRKICPNSGIIIISRKPEEEELRSERGFIFLEPDSGENTWIDAIVRSRQSLVMPQK